MPKPITASISLSRVDKSLFIEGKKGKYLAIAIFENRDGPDQYGNTHFITQDVSREMRDQGKKGPIIGNAKFPSAERRQEPPRRPVQRPSTKNDPDLDGDYEF